MKKSLFTLSVLILAQCSFSAYGNTGEIENILAKCEKFEQNTDEHSRCLDNIKDSLERELQTWLNHHTLLLEEKVLVNGRHSALKLFNRSQKNFITYRDNNCRWQYLAIAPQRGAETAYKQCVIRMTQNRIKELSVIQ